MDVEEVAIGFSNFASFTPAVFDSTVPPVPVASVVAPSASVQPSATADVARQVNKSSQPSGKSSVCNVM